MRNIKLTIEYDGKDFNGWQKQPNKLNIQGEIERAIENITGEKVDLIRYSENPEEFIANALSPAKNVTVNIIDPMKKEALAIVTDDNLSLAIGKKGSNIKLASKLTKYKIEIKTLAQINEEGNKDSE